MRLIPILFTVFLDYLGFGLVFPIFFPMFMDPASEFMSPETSQAVVGLVVGVLISTYALFQFFASPILGTLSDRYGRKPMLQLSLFITSVGFLLGAFGTIISSVLLLFFARLLAGIGAGNFSVAQAAIADMAQGTDKTKDFGTLNMAWGVGLVIGPFLGGQLSTFSLFGQSPFVTPFWVALALSLINVALVTFGFKETYTSGVAKKLLVFTELINFKKAFRMPSLRVLFIMMFIFSFGWGFFCEFLPFFLLKRYDFGSEEIGNTYAYIGILVAFFQGIAIRPFASRYAPKSLLRSGLFLLGTSTLALLFIDDVMLFLLTLVPIIFFEALIYPASATLVSNLSNEEEQGENLGINQSIQSLAIALSPLFSGSFVALYPVLPIWIGSLSTLIAFLSFLFFRAPEPEIEEESEEI